MIATAPDLLERIRQQFNAAPYPRIPLEDSPKKAYARLYTHNLATPYYIRNQRLVSTAGKLILDVGCGSGYTSLMLAEANPGAKIVGIDISSTSIDLAKKRLAHYGFEDAQFHVMGVEALSSLGMQFDYINCDEVLYLLLDPIAGLEAMRSVLKPEGLIRANFHSTLQRQLYMQIQEFSEMVGLMQSDSQDEEVRLLREVMNALRPQVYAKSTGWSATFENDDQRVLANHLLRGDKGWIIPEFFAALRQTQLEFVSMVDWRSWELTNLFSDIGELPIEIAMRLAESSEEEQLHMFELLHPISHRLLDLWCGHPDQALDKTAPESWSPEEWQSAKVCLHPQVLSEEFREDLMDCAAQNRLFNFSDHLAHHDGAITVDSLTAACFLPLLEGACGFATLTQRWLQLRPLNPVTLAPSTEQEAQTMIRSQLERLEELGYLMLEKQPG